MRRSPANFSSKRVSSPTSPERPKAREKRLLALGRAKTGYRVFGFSSNSIKLEALKLPVSLGCAVAQTWAMTEQEAEAWAKRLTRIWTKGRPLRRETNWLNFRHYSAWDIIGGQFQFFSYISGDAHLLFTSIYPFKPSLLHLLQIKGGEAVASIECHLALPAVIYPGASHSEDAGSSMTFVTKWLPVFRRGCWLSGCDIEASAHEKAEWMQGFTREEIEAWNLNWHFNT